MKNTYDPIQQSASYYLVETFNAAKERNESEACKLYRRTRAVLTRLDRPGRYPSRSLENLMRDLIAIPIAETAETRRTSLLIRWLGHCNASGDARHVPVSDGGDATYDANLAGTYIRCTVSGCDWESHFKTETIDITPTPEGIAASVRLFEEQIERSEELIADIEAKLELLPDDGEVQLGELVLGVPFIEAAFMAQIELERNRIQSMRDGIEATMPPV